MVQKYVLTSFFLLFFCLSNLSFAQTEAELLQNLHKTNDSNEKLKILEQIIANTYLNQKYTTAKDYAKQSLQIAQEIGKQDAQATASLWLGKTNHELQDFENALQFLLNANNLFQSIKDNQKRYETLTEIGFLYRDWQTYDKASNYFLQAYQLSKQLANARQEVQSLERLASSYLQAKQYTNASTYYSEALKIYQEKKDFQNTKITLEKLSTTARLANNLEEALNYASELLSLSREMKDTASIVKSLNSVGFFHKQLKQADKALPFFQEALTLTQRQTDKSASAWINAGVIYSNMADYATASTYYKKALQLREKQGNRAEVAEVYNYLAVNDYLSGNNLKALEAAEEALALAKPIDAKQVLQETYKILSDINQRIGNSKEARTYLQFYNQTLNEILSAKNQQAQASMQKQIDSEKLEGEYKLLLSEKEKQELASKKLLLEIEQQQKDLAISEQKLQILERDKQIAASNLALEQAEKDRITKTLLLLQKELESKERAQAIALLEREKALQAVALAQQKQKEEQQKREIDALAQEKKQKEEQLKQEEKIRFYSIIISGLIFLFVLLGVFLFIQTLKRNEEKKRRQLIEKQNIELEQKVRARTQELLERNEEIEQINEEIQQQNAALSFQSRELSIANATKDKLFAIIGHDMRSPINALKSLLELLDSQNISPEEFINFSGRLKYGVEHVHFTLNNLLQWANSQMQGLVANPQMINLHHLGQENIELLSQLGANKNIQFDNQIKKEARAFADPDQINLVLRNLVSNAIKFTNDGGSITLASRKEGNFWLVEVHDTGIGMRDENVKKIFDRDVHYTTQGTRGEKGTGLGLLLCQEMIEKNNGIIWVESELGKGTSFKFTLPIQEI